MTKKTLTPYMLSASLCFVSALHAQTVAQVWNFTENGNGVASNLSDAGLNMTFFGSDPTASDGGFTIDRANGTSGDVNLGVSLSEANTSSITLSISLFAYDYSSLTSTTDDFFTVKMRNDATNTVYADIGFKEQDSQDRVRLTGLSAIAGIATSTDSGGPITYGLTLDLVADTYTYWIGTPSSNGSTWESRFGATHSSALDIGDNSIDALQWALGGVSSDSGNSLILDQIEVSYVSTVPEPSTYALIAGLLSLSAAMIRRRN